MTSSALVNTVLVGIAIPALIKGHARSSPMIDRKVYISNRNLSIEEEVSGEGRIYTDVSTD